MIIRYGCDLTLERDGYYITAWIEGPHGAEPVESIGPITELNHARTTQRDIAATTKRLVDRRLEELKISLRTLSAPPSDAHRREPL